MSNDLISRQATLKHIEEIRQDVLMMNDTLIASLIMDGMYLCETAVRNQPSTQPEIVRCGECVYRRSCMLQHFAESNAVDGTKIDWSDWYCADGVRDISKSDERQEKE